MLTEAIVDEIISIHAPMWGATPGGQRSTSWRRHFNSRPRVGGDIEAAMDDYGLT